MKINVIEYVSEGKWYLTIGNKAPWDNLHIRVPKWLAVRVTKVITHVN